MSPLGPPEAWTQGEKGMTADGAGAGVMSHHAGGGRWNASVTNGILLPPCILDVTYLDHCILATEQDWKQAEEIHRILFPALRWSRFFGQPAKVYSRALGGTGMTTKRRRRFTADFKKRVALEALRGDRTVQAIAAKHEVHPNQVGTWKR